MTLPHTHEGGNTCLACDVEKVHDDLRALSRFATDRAVSCLERITAALAEREATGWISTSERMPEAGERVWFFADSIVRHGKYDKYFANHMGFAWLTSEVTHWMPRPVETAPAPPSPPATIEEK